MLKLGFEDPLSSGFQSLVADTTDHLMTTLVEKFRFLFVLFCVPYALFKLTILIVPNLLLFDTNFINRKAMRWMLARIMALNLLR